MSTLRTFGWSFGVTALALALAAALLIGDPVDWPR